MLSVVQQLRGYEELSDVFHIKKRSPEAATELHRRAAEQLPQGALCVLHNPPAEGEPLPVVGVAHMDTAWGLNFR